MRRLLSFAVVVAVLIGVALLLSRVTRQPGAPTFDHSVSTISESGNIKMYEPSPGETVGQPLVIVGEARVFESMFNYRITDPEGHVLAAGFSKAAAPDAGQFGPLSVAVDYGYPQTASGFVEVYTHSAKDGSEIDLVKIPVAFRDSRESQTAVKVYLTNERAAQLTSSHFSVTHCGELYPASRVIAKTEAVARATLEQLLNGPTPAEAAAGYTSAMSAGVQVNGLTIKDHVATVDLSDQLTSNSTDQCRLSTIAAQIRETLRQFTSVTAVNIMVDGNLFTP